MALLSGQTAIITGGSRGIGKGIVERFMEEGAEVAFTYVSSDAKAKAVEEELSAKYGIKVKGYKSNAASFSDCEALITNVLADFGKIDTLVNNAGVTRDNLILRMTEEHWDEVMEINLKSSFNLTKHVVKPMMKARKGSIINMTSVVGIMGNAGQSNYAASKAGMIGFTKSIAQELGSRNIRCNAVAPGFIETEMTHELSDEVKAGYSNKIPMKRMGAPSDIANVCIFLASDMSAYVSGQTVSVCGAMCT